MDNPSKADLLEIWKDACEDQRFFTEDYHRRLAFFGGLVPALVAATVAGTVAAKEPIQWLALLVGPVLIFAVAAIGLRATHQSYQRWLEVISRIAKLEYRLGLHTPVGEGDSWLASESLITERNRQGQLFGVHRAGTEHRRHLFQVPYGRDPQTRRWWELSVVERALEEPHQRLQSSDEFVRSHLNAGTQNAYWWFFRACQVLALWLFVILLVSACDGFGA